MNTESIGSIGENWTDTVLSNSSQNQTAVKPTRDAFTLISVVLYCIVVLLGFFGNILVIVIFLRCKRLRIPGNFFIINLAITDLGVLICVVPIITNILSFEESANIYSYEGCWWHGFVLCLSCAVSIVAMAPIAVVRCICICHPSKSKTWLTWAKCIGVAILVWFYVLLFCIPLVTGSVKIVYIQQGFACSVDWFYSSAFSITALVCGYGLVSGVMLFCYTNIYWTYYNSKKEIERMGGRRNESSSSSKFSEEMRLATQLLVVYILYNVFVAPYQILNFITHRRADAPTEIYLATTIFFFLNSAVNPLIYLYFNRVFRKEVFKLLCPQRCASDSSVLGSST